MLPRIVYVYMYIMYVYMYICMYTCVYICMYTCIYRNKKYNLFIVYFEEHNELKSLVIHTYKEASSLYCAVLLVACTLAEEMTVMICSGTLCLLATRRVQQGQYSTR